MISEDEIRRAVVDSILDTLGDLPAQPWVESGFHYWTFPPKDPSSVAPHSFAVGILDSFGDTPEGRQRRGVGIWTTTTLAVKWLSTLRSDDQSLSVDEALADGRRLANAVLNTSKRYGFEIRFEVATRDGSPAEGTVFLGELRFTVRHLAPRT